MKALTLTIISKMTANYGETLGNIGSVQKFYSDGKTYAMRSKESMKYAIMNSSGLYDDLSIVIDKVAQKEVSDDKNASTTRALEGGYMNTSIKFDVKIKGEDGITKGTYIRNSSFYLTDAVACEPLPIDARFHTNLNMAKTFAEANDLNVQNNAKEVGLNPFQYEYDNNLKKYSITIDLTEVGVDKNYNLEASNDEKAERVNMILDAIEHLSLIVRGNLDNAEPIFIVGGLSKYKTHLFDNLVTVRKNKLSLTETLKSRSEEGEFEVGLLGGDVLDNESQIKDELNPISVVDFFENLKEKVKNHYKGN